MLIAAEDYAIVNEQLPDMDDRAELPDSIEEVAEVSPADRDLARRVMTYLASRNVPSLRHVVVEARAGVVTLRGRVYTYYEKQLCIQCCRRVAGVLELINAVEVVAAMPGAAVVA